VKRVLFVTTCGEATDVLVARVLAAAAEAEMQLAIEVVSEHTELDKHEGKEFDMLLLSPLLRYLKNEKEDRKILQNQPFEVVSSIIYGSLNGAELFWLISKHLFFDRPSLH